VSAVEWDAGAYDRVADPQLEWGKEVLDRLDLRGDETVLDAGCGTGRLTALLVELVPDGRVIGVDGSRSMVERARQALPERVELIVGDLLDLELPEPVDVIFSNATFHWITDHDRLFRHLHGLVVPGGVLEAQCGAQGNVAEFERAIEALGGDERFAPYLRGERRVVRDPGTARAEAGHAPRAPRVPAGGRARLAPGSPAGRPARRVHRCGHRLDGTAARTRLRSPEHLGPKAVIPANG
jgi:trans-aconitate methyltransferase